MSRTVVFTSGAQLYRALRRATEGLQRKMAEAATGAVHEAHRAAVDETHRLDLVFTGDYIDSFRVVENPGPNGGGALTNDSEHADTIENGRRPGARAPPLARILLWVEGKLGVPYPQSYPLAKTIQQRIHERGLPPQKIMEYAAIKAQDYLEEAVADDTDANRIAADLIRYRS